MSNLTETLFAYPKNLGVLPQLWLQARLTLSLTAIQEKFSRILLSVACELWLRGQSATMEDVLLQTARALTIRLAEKARPSDELVDEIGWIHSDSRNWMLAVCHVLVSAHPVWAHRLGPWELWGEPESSAEWPSKSPGYWSAASTHYWASGPYEWCLCPIGMVPASWASKIAPKLLENAPENAQKPQKINIACPKRSCDETPVEGAKQLLQAVKFAAKTMPGFRLGLENGWMLPGAHPWIHIRLVEPCMMRGLQPLGPTRTTLEVIIPSQEGLTPEKWKENSHTVPTWLAFQLQSVAIVAYQWEPASNGSATQESTVAQPYVCWMDSASQQICRACFIPATCSLCCGTCLAGQLAGTNLPRQESPQEGSSGRSGWTSTGDSSATSASYCSASS